ncbi:hypothetical protein FQZ97_943840 [compost metagenome]
MCVKSFRRKYLLDNHIKFESNVKFGEDALMSFKAILLSQYVSAVPSDNILYYYRRIQPNSAMHTISFTDQMSDQLEVTLALQKFMEKNGLLEMYRGSFDKWVSDGVGSILYRIDAIYRPKINSLEQEIQNIQNSRSWRLTGYVRRAKDRLKQLFKTMS